MNCIEGECFALDSLKVTFADNNVDNVVYFPHLQHSCDERVVFIFGLLASHS